MFFKETDATENFLLRRFVSKEGIWEIGLTPMAFGVRIRLGQVGNGWCTLDYCAGASSDWQQLILGLVMGHLSQFDESVTERALQHYFPRQVVKPMSEDLECLKALMDGIDERNKAINTDGENCF